MFHVKHPLPELPDVSRETSERLAIFVDLLLRWNRTINLIARGDEATIWTRHIADSLDLRALIPPNTDRAADFGSGGGFPGLILAIATGIPFHLVESDQRKAAFLREVARETTAPATIHATRIESFVAPPLPLITARALAPLDKLLAWSAPHLTPDGICIFPKGRTAADELTQAARQWHMAVQQRTSRTDPAATILRISEIRRV